MRILQTALVKALCVAFLLVGAALIWKPAGDWCHKVHACPYLPENHLMRTSIRIGAGTVALVAGLFTLLPLGRCGRRRRQIIFSSPHGNTIIRLDSVEASLNRALMKLPEIKRICVRLTPSEDQRKVHIQADMKVVGEGAREAADRVGQEIRDAATRLLGVDEVTAVDIYVSGMDVDLSATTHRTMTKPPHTPATRPAARAAFEPEPKPGALLREEQEAQKEDEETEETEVPAPGELLPADELSVEEPRGMKSFDPDALAGYDNEEPNADSEDENHTST